jgi:hypothetical protein
MSLIIHKLSTLCRSPKGFERARAIVDDVAQGPLASELNAHLGPSLDRLPAVVRLRNLRVRLKIPSRRLSTASLAEAWARAFALALHHALAYPESEGTYALRRYPSRAAYKAAMLYHIATRGLTPSWQFYELDAHNGNSPAEAALWLLLEEPEILVETLAEMASKDWLDPLLVLWDEPSLERVIQAIGIAENRPTDLSLEEIIELAKAAAAPGGLQSQWPMASRRQAVRLWLRLLRRLPARGIWHGLRLLRRLLETPLPWQGSVSDLLSDPIPFPSWCDEIVNAALHADVSSFPVSAGRNAAFQLVPGGASLVSSFKSALESLRPVLPSAVKADVPAKWVSSDCAGVLLLLATVRRLGWWQLVREPEFVRFGGHRALSFLLAASGMTLLGQWSPGDPIEPAVALFAGIFGEPDRVGMKQFFAEANVQAIAGSPRGETWPEALEAAASELARAFAQRIRGFRHSSRDAVVKQFVRTPGRILVEEQRLLVVLEKNPWAVALHISGSDDPLESVEWMTERRVEFVLEGL